jgi:hypothetical protein
MSRKKNKRLRSNQVSGKENQLYVPPPSMIYDKFALESVELKKPYIANRKNYKVR